MTATELSVYVTDPADKRRGLGYAFLKAVPGPTGRNWEVYHGGELVGTLGRTQYRPTRTSQKADLKRGHRVDLAPRTGWDAHPTDDRRIRFHCDTRNDALFYLIKELRP